MEETWKDVLGYEGLYEVSSEGNVNGPRKNNLVPGHVNSGYLFITLCKEGNVRAATIHRLVCIAFLGPPTKDKPFVNHIDGDKHNNRINNLEWCSHSNNMKHSYRILKNKPSSLGKLGSLHPTSKKFKCVSPEGEIYHIDGLRNFCRKNNLLHSSMSRVATGKLNHHKGWKCYYEQQGEN